MEFIEVLRPKIIDLVLVAKNKQEAIEKLTELLFEDGAINSKDNYIKDVLYRETQGPTGIGNFIAIPHGKSNSVVKTSVAMAKLKKPIYWETLDGNPVKIIFLFAVPEENRNNEHLKLLSQLAALLAHEDSQQQLLEATTPEQVLEIFKNRKALV